MSDLKEAGNLLRRAEMDLKAVQGMGDVAVFTIPNCEARAPARRGRRCPASAAAAGRAESDMCWRNTPAWKGGILPAAAANSAFRPMLLCFDLFQFARL